jgi:hypothetical protein
MKKLAHSTGDLLYAWVAELQYFVTSVANKMVVLFVAKCLFKEAGVFAELVFFHQSRIYQ